MKGFKLALSFLTVLPVRLEGHPQLGDLGRAGFWFPWIGLLLGVILLGGKILLDRLFPALLSAGIIVALWATLSGGLHLDGLADCCDALLAPASPERRLEILRDPRLGSFGGIGLAVHLLLKTLSLAAFPYPLAPFSLPNSTPLSNFLVPLLLAPTLGRWILLPLGRLPMARPGGLGAAFALGLSRRSIILSAALPLILAILAGPRGFLAITLALLGAASVSLCARSRLGGLTGDVLGLSVEVTELLVLLTFVAKI